MEKSKIYLIDPRSSLFPVVTGYIHTRDAAFDSARKYCSNLGTFDNFVIGKSGYISFVKFHKCPSGWNTDVRGMCYPAHKSGVRENIASNTIPVPNVKQLIRTHVHAPMQIEYKEPGYPGIQSEDIGKSDRPCGFLWVDKHKGPYAFWIPDLEMAIQDVESRGCEVLPLYKDWEMRVQHIRQISALEWDDMRTVGGIHGNSRVVRQSREQQHR